MKILAILAVFFCIGATRADDTSTNVPSNEAVPTVTTEQAQAGDESAEEQQNEASTEAEADESTQVQD